MGRTNRLTILLRLIYRFVPSWLFQYGSYYLYELRPQIANRPEFTPANQDLTCKIIRSNEEADELAATIDSDFRQRFAKARKGLDKGAIAFCVFTEREIASIGWVALNEEAKDSLCPLPLKVGFSNKEAFIGNLQTTPKYRRKHLAAHGALARLQFLKEKGTTVARFAVATGNVAAQGHVTKLGAETYARACYLKFLWWKSWKERPVSRASEC